MLYKSTGPIVSVLIFSSFFIQSASSFSCAQDVASDYNVTISLYRPSDMAERDVPQPPLAFPNIARPSTVHVLSELLLSIHVWPDSGATALIYALNPNLRDPLRLPERVRIIQIHPTTQVEAALSTGFLLRIHYDDKIVQEIVSSRDNLEHLVGHVKGLPLQRFENASARQTTLNCISSISDDFGQIADGLQARNQPTNHEMLLQVRGDIKLLTQTLRRIATSSESITRTDARIICSVGNDLKIKQDGFDRTRGIDSSSTPWPQALVRVRTINAQTGNPVHLLTVHFVPEALESLKQWDRIFPTLSSPTEWYLPEADYVLWAARSKNAASLGRVRISVRKAGDSQPFIVDIPVKQ